MNGPRSMSSLTDAYEGYNEGDPTAILYDARDFKRATAISYHGREYGVEFKDVECSTIYARWLTPEEQWDEFGREHHEDEADEYYACPKCGAERGVACEGVNPPDLWHEERAEAVPDTAPDDWQPSDSDPAWQTCKRTDDGAIKVYRCGVTW